MDFKLAMDLEELKYRTSKQCFKPVKFLKLDSREIKKLSKNDLLVLMHLTRASKFIDDIHFKLENHYNGEFLNYLNEEIGKKNKRAVLTKKMFLAQKSMFSPDSLGEQTKLCSNLEKTLGLGYFPDDLDENEFHKILNNMLDKGMIQEVRQILSQRTIVVRENDMLKAIDFVDAFDEFKEIAKELEKAKKYSSDKKFNAYLSAQIEAFKTADPELDAKADKLWAELDDSIFEFTITRECYDEGMTKTIYENEKLLSRLNDLDIVVYGKDSLGARVGIVNEKGTKLLKKLKGLVDVAREFMPYKDEYSSSNNEETDISQNEVDVDLIALTGDEGSYKGSVVLAQNLPNDDKLSLKRGGGRRNVYHRQVRKNGKGKIFKNLISEKDFKHFKMEADHWGTICHENTHSLGPNTHSSLGKYSSILEEYKADLGMYAFLDEFVKNRVFTLEQTRQIMVTSLALTFVKGKPEMHQAHRVRAVMITNRLLKTKSIQINKDNKLEFDFEKIKETTKKMLSEVVRLQIDKDVNKAKEYIEKWFVWTKDLKKIADTIKIYSKQLNGYLETPLADMMNGEDFEDRLNLMFGSNK